jgi:hypothetical protein
VAEIESGLPAIASRGLVVAIALMLIYASVVGGGLVSAQETANGTQNGSNQSVNGTETQTAANATQNNSSQRLEAAVEIASNDTDRGSVVLESVTLPENGYIAAYGGNFSLEAPTDDSLVGRTQYVRAGEFSDVVVQFNETIPKNTTVTVMVHNETSGDEDFSFTNQSSPDGPYLNESGFPIVDRVLIQNNSTATEPELFSPSRVSGEQSLPPGTSGKLVIAANGSEGTYTFSATENVTPQTTASNTTINGAIATGSVNESNSTFIYSGAISEFETNGNVSVRLNGRTVDPSVLGANRITLTKNSSEVQPGTVEYGFTAAEGIVPGGTIEGNETVSNSQINGTIGGGDQTDTIYYAGQMTSSRLIGDAKVVINGRVTSESTGGSPSANQGAETPNLGQLPGQDNSSEQTQTQQAEGQTEGQNGGQTGGPDFRVSNITLSSQRVEATEPFRVTVTITNTGSSQVTANLGLASEGQVVDDASVGLFAGGSRQITFEHRYEASGNYVLKIALLSEDGEVLAMSSVDQTVTVVPEGELTTASSNNSNTTSSGGPGFGILPGILGILTTTVVVRYWRRSA